MTWQTVIQTAMTGFAAIGAWFLYDLVREFKMFKVEAKTDINTLKNERASFQNTVRNAELSISIRVTEIQRVHNEFTLDVKKSLIEINAKFSQLQGAVDVTSKKAENFEGFLDRSLTLCRTLDGRLKKQEHEMRSLKIDLGKVVLFKNGNGKG